MVEVTLREGDGPLATDLQSLLSDGGASRNGCHDLQLILLLSGQIGPLDSQDLCWHGSNCIDSCIVSRTGKSYGGSALETTILCATSGREQT